MEREVEEIKCDSIQDIPSIDKINGLSRNKTLKVVFGKRILRKRGSIGNQWKKELNDFQIGIHTQNPEINIARLISDKEIVDHQDFFEKCAKDYRDLATRLINKLANQLGIEKKDGFLISSMRELIICYARLHVFLFTRLMYLRTDIQ